MTGTSERAIRDLVAGYADAVNARDEARWAATWSDDGVWDLAGHVVEGRDAVVAMWHSAMGGFESVLQFVHHGTVSVEGDRAAGRFTLSELARRAGDGTTLLVGCYRDDYVRTEAGWRFARRRFDVLYRGELPGGDFGAVPTLEPLTAEPEGNP